MYKTDISSLLLISRVHKRHIQAPIVRPHFLQLFDIRHLVKFVHQSSDVFIDIEILTLKKFKYDIVWKWIFFLKNQDILLKCKLFDNALRLISKSWKTYIYMYVNWQTYWNSGSHLYIYQHNRIFTEMVEKKIIIRYK